MLLTLRRVSYAGCVDGSEVALPVSMAARLNMQVCKYLYRLLEHAETCPMYMHMPLQQLRENQRGLVAPGANNCRADQHAAAALLPQACETAGHQNLVTGTTCMEGFGICQRLQIMSLAVS